MALKIKALLKRLDEIAEERHNLHLRERDVVRQPEIRYRRPSTISLIEESDVFGREKEKQELVNMLVSDGSSGTEVSVIPIVGMGGLGKTTLSQLVYNDEIVKKQFEIRAWVCVSDDFNLIRLTKEIIASVCKETPNFDQLNLLVEHLQTKLHQKKFLLVLDDVWSEDPGYWDVLKAPLRCGAKGSKIIVTTRSQKVADIMGTNIAYRLGIMSDEHGLELFRKRAFANDFHGNHQNLDAIGEKIVKKCKGVPLAVKTLGGILQTTREANEWNYILECGIWELQQKENNIIPLLRLSYDCLPSHLKQCFEYCAIFPKDYVFEREKLVKMWMGAGFIRSDERKEMEDIGRGYFNDLLWRSFFQSGVIKWEREPRYKMHDLIHDVAQLVSKEECFRLEDGSTSHFLEKARYSSLFCTNNDQTISESLYECKSLRTFILLHTWSYQPSISLNPDNIFQQLRCIRVLDLSCTRIVELPDSIGELKHLRYLDLSYTLIHRLPDSASRLYNLQTLNLINCFELCELPKDTRNLINLRHLAFERGNLLSMPLGIGILTNLQTFPWFIVGKESGREIEQLKKLNNLRGSLWISQLQNVVNAKEAELKNKQYIYSLILEWNHDGMEDMRDEATRVEEEVLESLQPHTNLIHLQTIGYFGGIFPSWLHALSNLKTISFRNCPSCKILPPLGQLPSLEKLVIQGMKEVRCIGREFCGVGMVRAFPMLKVIEIGNMPKLEEWCGVEEGAFPCLHNLCVGNCKSLTALPRRLLPSLGQLNVYGWDDKMILSSLPYLTSLSSLHIGFMSKLDVAIPSGLIQSLTQLKDLHISECSKLTFLPEYGLPTAPLNRLTFVNCDSITSLPSWLQNLEYLELRSSKLTSSLPEGLKNLSSLQSLYLDDCPKLATIPEEGLPTTLQSLMIERCPLLEERCRKQCGQDWFKISHIPNIGINGELISGNWTSYWDC